MIRSNHALHTYILAACLATLTGDSNPVAAALTLRANSSVSVETPVSIETTLLARFLIPGQKRRHNGQIDVFIDIIR